MKRKSEYTQLFEENTTSQRKQHNSGSKYGELNDLVFKWFKQARANNIPFVIYVCTFTTNFKKSY
jgi:hypothetical protein